MKKNKSTFLKIVELIFFSIISKIFAFIRSLTLAFYYGASRIADVFNISQNIPSSIFTLIGTALTSGFIPTYIEIEKKEGKQKADSFFNNLINILLVFSILFALLGVFGSSKLVCIFGNGFKEETFYICNIFVKIVMPCLIAMIISHICSAYLQIHNKFNQNSIMNIPYNIVQIIFIIMGFYFKNYYLLAFGLLISTYIQLIYITFLMKKYTSFHYKFLLDFKDRYIKKILILVFPIFLSTGANQINAMIDKSLASGLVEGSISALNYSSEVITIVTQVVILNIITLLFPKMSKMFADKCDNSQKNEFFSKVFSSIGIIIFPLSIILFFYSNDVIKVLFGRGAFDSNTIVFVGNALKIYSIGIIGFSYRDVLNKMFYSMKKTKIPMINSLISVIFNILLNFALINQYKYLGLAFATSFSSILCTILLFINFCRISSFVKENNFFFNYFKIIISSIFMIIVVDICSKYILIDNIFLKLVVNSTISITSYIIFLLLIREKYAIYFLSKAKAKVVKK